MAADFEPRTLLLGPGYRPFGGQRRDLRSLLAVSQPKRPGWRLTTPRSASWCGPGIPARTRRWPGCCTDLREPPLKTAEPAWEAFPDGLRQEIDAYFGGLAKVHRTLSG